MKIDKLEMEPTESPLMYFEYFVVRATHPNQPVGGANARQGKLHFAGTDEIGAKTLCNMLTRYVEENVTWDSPMLYIRKPDDGAGETCKLCWNLTPMEERKNTGEYLNSKEVG